MPGPQHLQSTSKTHRLEHRPTLDLGPAICADDEASRRHEWLLTNGRGGYACGSIAGVLDRRYHAVLAAAVEPPDTRSVIVAKLDERLPASNPMQKAQQAAWAEAAQFLSKRIQTAPVASGRAPDMSPAAAAAMRTVLHAIDEEARA